MQSLYHGNDVVTLQMITVQYVKDIETTGSSIIFGDETVVKVGGGFELANGRAN